MKVAKYACSHVVNNTIRFFKKEFPNLTESTVVPWVNKYREEIKKKSAETMKHHKKILWLFNETSQKENPQLFSTKLTEKIPDPCNVKEHSLKRIIY